MMASYSRGEVTPFPSRLPTHLLNATRRHALASGRSMVDVVSTALELYLEGLGIVTDVDDAQAYRPEKTCRVCRSVFVAKQIKQITCGVECRKERRREIHRTYERRSRGVQR